MQELGLGLDKVLGLKFKKRLADCLWETISAIRYISLSHKMLLLKLVSL